MHIHSRHLSASVLALVCCALCAACRVYVSVDDVGDGGIEDDTVRDVDNTPSTGFGNRTIVPLENPGVGYDGVDILLVVDNSDTMLQEQARLASDIYTLITELTNPTDSSFPVRNIRVGVTTTDMGLPFGAEENGNGVADLPSCLGTGNDGALVGIVNPPPSFVRGNEVVPCAMMGGTAPWIETTEVDPDPLFAQRAACMVLQGNSGCTVEQPLAAMRRALQRRPDFLQESHLLAVVILTDEEDCSIEDSDLLETAEWQDMQSRQTACNYPERNNDYLFTPEEYREDLLYLKENNPAAVLFSAVAGAPQSGECTGDGSYLATNECLSLKDMELWVETVQIGDIFRDRFHRACSSSSLDADGARPARRLVSLAQLFAEQGFMNPICDSTYTPLVRRIVTSVKETAAHGSCRLSEALETQAASSETCADCVQSRCEMYVEILRTGDEAADTNCPDELVYGGDYNSKLAVKRTYDGDTLISTRLFCPVEKMPAPLDCKAAAFRIDGDRAGWAYCENDVSVENTEYTCSDGVDNDGNSFLDCRDPACANCLMCGADGCDLGCENHLLLTDKAAAVTAGYNLFLECPFR